MSEIQNLIQLIKSKKLDEAEFKARNLIEKNPRALVVFDLLCKSLIGQNKVNEAISIYKKAIQIDENFYTAYNNLGNLLKSKGKIDEAKFYYQKAIKIKPKFPTAYYNLGLTFLKIGKLNEAKTIFEKCIKIKPNYVEALINLGIVLKNLGHLKEAKLCITKAISFKPNLAQAYNNLGNILFELEKVDQAIINYSKALEINPKYMNVYQNLMELYEKTNDQKNLEETIKKVQNLDKNNKVANLYEGIILSKKNKFLEAKKVLENIVFEVGDEKNEILKSFALGKCFDGIGDTRKAFGYFEIANKTTLLQKNILKFDKKRYLNEIEKRKNYFKKSNIKSWTSYDEGGRKNSPIFLIGFPRSGTTLLDTILSTHASIEVIEEKLTVKKLIDEINKIPSVGLKNLEKMKNKKIKEIQKIYFDSLNSEKSKSKKTKIIIDKLPLNIIHVGEILRIFPKAKFILCIRHPCDSVLSCFMQNFELNDAMSNFLDLGDTVYLYDKVMSLWLQYKSIFNINYHIVKYEDIVSNFDKTTKLLLKFLNVPWNPILKKYYITAKKKRRITTPSYNQVTKKLYLHANGRWHKYHDQIYKIYPKLKPWIKKFNYKDLK